MYKIKLDEREWIVILGLCIFVLIYSLTVMTLLLLAYLETRLNINIRCICRGYRINSNIVIPVYLYCRCRRNINTKIIPKKSFPRMITIDDYNRETGNIVFKNPDENYSIGVIT